MDEAVNCTLEVLASNVPCSVVPLPGMHAALCSAAVAWLKPENLEQMYQVSSSELHDCGGEARSQEAVIELHEQ